MAPLTVPVRVNLPATPWLPQADMFIKMAEIFFTIITICCMIPVVVIEGKYLGIGSPSPSWTITLGVISLPFPFMMVCFPYMYDKHDRFKTGAKIFGKARTNMILTVFWSVMWFTDVIALTVHTTKPENCQWDETLSPGSLMYEYGDTYAHDWVSQCYAAKAGAAFVWFNWLSWLASMLIGLKMYYEEKQLKNQEIPKESQEKASAVGRRIDKSHSEEAATYQRRDTAGSVESASYQRRDTLPNEEENFAMGRANSFEQSRPLTTPVLEAYGNTPAPSAGYFSPPPASHVEMPIPQVAPSPSPHPVLPAVAMPDHQAYIPPDPRVYSSPTHQAYVPPEHQAYVPPQHQAYVPPDHQAYSAPYQHSPSPVPYGYPAASPPQPHGYAPGEKEQYGERY